MRAARLHAAKDLRIHHEPDPVPGADEELVQITAVGLCGSDLHWFDDGGIGDAVLTTPVVPGHEFAGVIAAGPRKGTRVALDPAIPCRECELCEEGHPNLCVNIKFAGHGVNDGAMRELMTWPKDRLHPVSDELTAEDIAMLEPLGVAIHALDLAHSRPGEPLVVIGCGPIGLCALQVARAKGATTLVAVEPLAHRREAAAKYADPVLDPASPTYAEDLHKATGPLGAPTVVECAGNDEGIDLSVDAARPGATVVLAGIPGEDRSSFMAAVARRKGLTFRMVRRMKEVYPRAIALVTSGMVDVRSLVSHVFDLDDAVAAFELACAREGLKVIISPTRGGGCLVPALPLVIAVDCSTTAAKALVVDPATGAVLQTGRAPLETSQPAPGFHEQDAATWVSAVKAAIREAVDALPPDARARVAAIGITHQRESFALLDAHRHPIRPAILWVDSRAHRQIADLGGRVLNGDRSVHDVSGKPPDTTPAIYKIAWLAEHEPQALAAAAHVADVQSYLAQALTGRFATSRASADTFGLFDLAEGTWSDELVALAGIRREQLPELVDAGEDIGDLLPDVAAELGLPHPVPLVAGSGDGQSAGLALGVLEPGVAYLNLGTSMVCGVATQEYLTSPAFRTLAGVAPGTYVLETVLNAAAYLADWAARFTDTPVAELERQAAAIPAGAEGLIALPYWNAAQTPYWDPLARGAVIGWHGRHTPAHLYRAILEGVALELRLQLTMLEQATGEPVRVLRAVGGGARSRLWVQIVADVTGREVSVMPDGEYSALGAAIDACRVIGVPFSGDVTEAAHTVQPNPETTAAYDREFAIYQGLYPALKETFAALSENITGGSIPVQ